MLKQIFLTLILSHSTLFGGLITNGTFDLNVAGWDFNGADSMTWSNTYQSSPNPSGGYAIVNAAPTSSPFMYQTISSLVEGKTYELTWDMISAYHCCGDDQVAGVRVGINDLWWAFSVPKTQNSWQSYSLSFLYSAGSNVLVFQTQVGTDQDAGFDNIVLREFTGNGDNPPGEIPEPATWMMMAAGLAVFGLTRRRW